MAASTKKPFLAPTASTTSPPMAGPTMWSVWWVVSATVTAGTSLGPGAISGVNAERDARNRGASRAERNASTYACHAAWVNANAATRTARARSQNTMTERRSRRSAMTPVNGPKANPAMDLSPRANPTAATPPVREWM